MKPSLSELQHWMLWAITDPRGATVALQDPDRADLGARYSAPKPDQQNFIAETGDVSRGRRLDVYAEAYFARLAETLGDDFSTVKAVLGENLFLKLVANYLKVHPSRATNINEAGSHLSSFAHGWLTDSTELSETYAYLPDLCELEWRQIEAFYATGHAIGQAPLDPATFAERTDEEWSNAHFTFANGVALINSAWDLPAIQNDPDQQAIAVPCSLLIAQVEGHAQIYRLDRIEALILARLLSGASLDEALQIEGENDDAAAELSNWFGKWMGLGLFKEIQF